ncbi:nucleotide sugar dehydrogenase [Planktomarina temperata]|nr:nucleotide sugar dehydrogenase [Planktomarina temperata]
MLEYDINVIGLGYIGLPLAVLAARSGLTTHGFDTDVNKVEQLNNNRFKTEEPGLEEALSNARKKNVLHFSQFPKEAKVHVVAVPTPIKIDKSADLDFVAEAITSIAALLRKGDCVIIESTCPIGTTEAMVGLLQDLRADLVFPSDRVEQDADVSIVYCPERVLPGVALKELVNNDRVLGGITKNCAQHAKTFYENFVVGKCEVISNSRHAEAIKLVENAYRDVNIAFANEVSILCNELEISHSEIIEYANRHPRVNILKPGPGVGGHCIAVDPWFLVESAQENTPLIKCSRAVNDYKTRWTESQILHKANLMNAEKICILGLAFKPNVSDLRESPALKIFHNLVENTSFHVEAIDPMIEQNTEQNINVSCISDFDVNHTLIVKLVDHDIFQHLIPCEMQVMTFVD